MYSKLRKEKIEINIKKGIMYLAFKKMVKVKNIEK